MVMKDGQASEFGSPQELLEDEIVRHSEAEEKSTNRKFTRFRMIMLCTVDTTQKNTNVQLFGLSRIRAQSIRLLENT